MKNLKNTIAAVGLMAILGMNATVAKAGLLITDKATPADGAQCQISKDDFGAKIKGLIVIGLNGLIVIGQNGLLITDGLIITDQQCKDGLLITD
jgi:hypothetical protein